MNGDASTALTTVDVYGRLAAAFEHTYKLKKGGTELDYLTLEQVVSRLNDVLGVDGWDFAILAHGQDEGHCWVQGELRAYFETRTITRQQFGECAIQRGMALGDSRKGACSDALKKCASLIGVGLYLSSKEERASVPATPTPITGARSYDEVWQEPPSGDTIGCADCSAAITPWKRKDGTEWSAGRVAEYARGKYGRVLCWNCGRKAAG